MKLLPIYRVSTAGQAGDDGKGLERQRQAVRAVANAHQAVLLDPVEIKNVSGSDLAATPEWRDTVRQAIVETDTHVAADAIDRILRVEDFNFAVYKDLLATGTHIYTPGKVHDLADAEDAFMAGLLALIGGREKSEIKRRIQAGREAKRRRGEWPLRLTALPRGIIYDPETKTWSYDSPEADVIKSVFHQFVVERRPLRAIGRTIGKPMQTVSTYLKNPIYKGWLVYDQKRGEKYPQKDGRQPDRKKIPRAPHEIIEVPVFGSKPGQLPRLIPEEMWADAQKILLENSKTSLRRREAGKPKSWATGFLSSWYAVLGPEKLVGFVQLSFKDKKVMPHTVYANGGDARGFKRYACRCGGTQERERGLMQRCALRHLRADAVNATVDAFFTDLTSDDWFFEAVRSSLDTGRDSAVEQHKILEQRLVALGRREERLISLQLDGRIPMERFVSEQDKIRAERSYLRSETGTIEQQQAIPTPEDLDVQSQEWLWNSDWPHERKRAWLRRYVQAIYLSNEGVEGARVRVNAGGGKAVFATGRRMDFVMMALSRKPPKRRRGTIG